MAEGRSQVAKQGLVVPLLSVCLALGAQYSMAAAFGGGYTAAMSRAAASRQGILLGIRTTDGVNGKLENLPGVESWTGKTHAVQLLFRDFCSAEANSVFQVLLTTIWNHGAVPIFSWQPTADCAGKENTPNNIDTLIANGAFDSYLNDMAVRFRHWLAGPDGVYGNGDDRRVYIRLAHEMNGTWYAWSETTGKNWQTGQPRPGNGNSPGSYVAMWRHVFAIFRAKGLDASHVQWIWCVNNADMKGSQPAEHYYPGDDYVDWVGIDGYNKNKQSPEDVFDDMIQRVTSLTSKPLGILEVGVGKGNQSEGYRNKWIESAYEYFAHTNVKMVVYFNKADYVIYGKHQLGGYKKAVTNPSYISGDRRNPRLLTDSQFEGR
jgi:mannan endo-1,4-beta-mannosidase